MRPLNWRSSRTLQSIIVSVKTSQYYKLNVYFKLFKCHSDVNVRKSFFSQRIINVWNSLSSDTVDFGTLRSFKRTIKLVDFHNFLNVLTINLIYVFIFLYIDICLCVCVCVRVRVCMGSCKCWFELAVPACLISTSTT